MRDRGFTLVESLVALALTLSVSGALFALVTPNAQVSQAQPEAMDMQQRARVAADALSRDLLMAGAGLSAGPQVGTLGRYFAPVVPRRMGLTGSDAYDVARPDALTLAYVSGAAAQTTLGTALTPGAATLDVDALPNCPIGHTLCGLDEGATALVFDDEGHFDFFAITSVRGAVGDVRHLAPTPSHAYRDDAYVAEATTYTYYFDAANHQLRRYDGYQSDVPLIDHVVSLRFEYFGDRQPPIAPKPPPGIANCLYDDAGNLIGAVGTLPGVGGSLAPLPLAMLSDGPWCGSGSTRFDADLLRVRKVRVAMRIQAGLAGLRGTGPDFIVPGISRSPRRSLPDYSVTFDIAPRNLELVR